MSDRPTDGDDLNCGYCNTNELVYELETNRGVKKRCIRCLAVEHIQEKFTLPFEAWVDRDDIEPPDSPDAPDFDPFDPRKHDYETARAWSQVLARLVDDDPIVKRDPETHGTIFKDTREFLINVMGSDAYKPPSQLRGGADE